MAQDTPIHALSATIHPRSPSNPPEPEPSTAESALGSSVDPAGDDGVMAKDASPHPLVGPITRPNSCKYVDPHLGQANEGAMTPSEPAPHIPQASSAASTSTIVPSATGSFTTSVATNDAAPPSSNRIAMLTNDEISNLDFIGPLTSNNLKPSQRERRARSKVQEKRQRKRNPAAISSITLEGLRAVAHDSLVALGDGHIYPALAQNRVQTAQDSELDALVRLGSSHLYFSVAVIFYEKLPRTILSRASLTVIRSVLLSSKALTIIASKFETSRPSNDLPRGFKNKELYAVVGAISIDSGDVGVKAFLSDLLGPVAKAVCEAGSRLPSLRSGAQSFDDPTSTILKKIKAHQDVSELESELLDAGLKRRHSAGKENDVPASGPSGALLVPTTPERFLKRRKSVHAETAPAPSSSEPGRTEQGDPGELSNASEAAVPEQTQGVSESATAVDGDGDGDEEPEDGENETDAQPQLNEGEGANASTKRKRKESPNLRDKAIQLAIIHETKKAGFRAWFPKAQPPTWAAILASIDDRDPLETCGDGAMHVVMTELLLALLKDNPDRSEIFRGIHGPLLTNSTFLHFIESARFFKKNNDSDTPKLPGNAFEVFAGAVAILESLSVLREWISAAFHPLFEAAIAARGNFKEQVSVPEKGKDKAVKPAEGKNYWRRKKIPLPKNINGRPIRTPQLDTSIDIPEHDTDALGLDITPKEPRRSKRRRMEPPSVASTSAVTLVYATGPTSPPLGTILTTALDNVPPEAPATAVPVIHGLPAAAPTLSTFTFIPPSNIRIQTAERIFF
ncbi:hypothetical protein C8R46DRAFT_1307911 [Mycena filopes]|nr:hypothetical protein C8R46DRAFT_1307911 [Mycena filopes]